MSERPRGLSRRGLLGIFGRGASQLREGLDDVQRAATGGPRAAAPPSPATPGAPGSRPYVRIQRPAAQCAEARAAAPGAWNIDFGGRALDVGASVIVTGGGLPEPVIVVHVDPAHFAASTGECPVDGSDLLWRSDEDLLRCGSCGSAWRLDGTVREGPATWPLGRVLVDAFVDDAGALEARIRLP